MQITDLIILVLVFIDVVSLSMVTFIFRWARKAMGNFRTQIMELLSGESEESVAIIEKLGHTIYQKLYRYFNLKIPDSSSIMKQSDGEVSPEITPEIQSMIQKYTGGSPASPGSSLAGVAGMMGINDPGFLKYLPLLEKFMKSKGGPGSNSGENLNSGEYW